MINNPKLTFIQGSTVKPYKGLQIFIFGFARIQNDNP